MIKFISKKICKVKKNEIPKIWKFIPSFRCFFICTLKIRFLKLSFSSNL